MSKKNKEPQSKKPVSRLEKRKQELVAEVNNLNLQAQNLVLLREQKRGQLQMLLEIEKNQQEKDKELNYKK